MKPAVVASVCEDGQVQEVFSTVNMLFVSFHLMLISFMKGVWFPFPLRGGLLGRLRKHDVATSPSSWSSGGKARYRC
jgi:hypothetical protein